MTTWNELTVDQRTYLDTLARAGENGVISSSRVEGIRSSEYWELRQGGFVDIEDMPDTMFRVKERITAKGLAVYQQGQTPAEPDELTRLREQVAALTAERDALVQAGNAVLDEVTVNKRGFISVAIGATVHSWNKSTGMGRALFALREVLIASAKKRAGNE